MPNLPNLPTLPVRGPFDLAASAAFLAGFTPATRPDADAEPGVLRLALRTETDWTPFGAAITQRGQDLAVALSGDVTDQDAALAQVARVLSVDVDGTDYPEVGQRDPVIGGLQRRRPGLRPVLFGSPYEAACWAVLSQRVQMTQAAAIKTRLTAELGEPVTVAGQRLTVFPAPAVLVNHPLPDLLPVKAERIRAIAAAALDGALDAGRLRELHPGQALTELARIKGIGPFSAQLVLIRGAGAPDLFPTEEGRLHTRMAMAYGLTSPSPAQLAEIAERWRPFRSWVGFLLRSGG